MVKANGVVEGHVFKLEIVATTQPDTPITVETEAGIRVLGKDEALELIGNTITKMEKEASEKTK